MNLKNWTVAKKIWFLAVLSALVLISVEAFNAVTMRSVTARLRDVGRTQLPVARSMAMADMMHDGLRAVVYRSIVAAYSNKKSELQETKQEYLEYSRNIARHLEEILKADVNLDIKEQTRAALVEVAAYVRSGGEVLDLAENGKIADAIRRLAAYQAAFKSLEEKLESLGAKIEDRAKISVDESEEVTERLKRIGILVSLSGLTVGLLLSFWINQDLVNTLKSMVQRLHGQGLALKEHTDGVESSAHLLSTATSQQAAAIQQTVSAMEEVTAMGARTADNAHQLLEGARASSDVVTEGRSAVERMLVEMESIKASNSEVMQQIETSHEQFKVIVKVIREIGEKTKVINDIVFQTKLLSFNASVEAARAGDHGTGFAVVADEIGKLAELSGNASKQIAEMLEKGTRSVSELVDSNREHTLTLVGESSNRIDEGKGVAEQCELVFSKIVDQVGQVSQLSADIAKAIKEQSRGLDDIGKAIRLFNESNQANSTTSKNASQISQDLQLSFKGLEDLMNELTHLVSRSPKVGGAIAGS